MADPSPTARSTPGGIALEDGFSSKVTLAGDPDISFWEKSIKPPGFAGGDPVDTTTMFNTTWRTKTPRSLIEMTPVTGNAAYDPAVLTQIRARINVEDTITITFPDGSTWAFFGWLKNFDPQEIAEGTQPEASFEFEVSNWDYVNDVESDVDLVSVEGT